MGFNQRLLQIIAPILQFTVEPKIYYNEILHAWCCIDCSQTFPDGQHYYHDVYCIANYKWRDNIELINESHCIIPLSYHFSYFQPILDDTLRQLSKYIVETQDIQLLDILIAKSLQHHISLFVLKEILNTRCDKIVKRLLPCIHPRYYTYFYQYILKYDTIELLNGNHALIRLHFLHYLFYTDKIYLYQQLFNETKMSYDTYKIHLHLCRELGTVKNGTMCFYQYLWKQLNQFHSQIRINLEPYLCRDIIQYLIKNI